MSSKVLRLQRNAGVLPDRDIGQLIDTEVVEAILDVPAADTRRLLASVVATLEEAVVSQLEAIEALKEPHLIILKTPLLAGEIRSSASAAGASGVAVLASQMEALATSATGDVSRDELSALVGQCYSALQGYLAVVFERYLVRD